MHADGKSTLALVSKWNSGKVNILVRKKLLRQQVDCGRLNQNLYNIRLQLHGAIYRPNSFVLMLRYCANLKAIRYESTSLNRIVADKSHSVIVA